MRALLLLSCLLIGCAVPVSGEGEETASSSGALSVRSSYRRYSRSSIGFVPPGIAVAVTAACGPNAIVMSGSCTAEHPERVEMLQDEAGLVNYPSSVPGWRCLPFGAMPYGAQAEKVTAVVVCGLL